ncbi:MAG: glycosidase [Gemmatimonas sp.]|nr:glycosidase [Gemmatimonas sp.]
MRSNPAGRFHRSPAAVLLACLPLLLAVSLGALPARAAPPPRVEVVTDDSGSRLQVGGRDFPVFGMNWDYMPIGHNYTYNLWAQPDEMIVAALDREMSLLQNMGVNAIRQSVGVPPRWVAYIHEKYGIFTVLNHVVGRYGLTLGGVWTPATDYGDPATRAQLRGEVMSMVAQYRGTPGVLMWLLGNENNYGLSWKSFEIEALPEGERDAARARRLYSLFGEIIRDVHRLDPDRPVAIANGDVQYIDLIAEECPDLDVFGTNVYRGVSARDLFQVVREKLGTPVMFTEFGADAFNAVTMREDQATQARYLLAQWREIYAQAAGQGRVGNAIGGLVFQWSDGWWKYLQDSRLDVHDTNASWPNGGYVEDFREGDNNMNEEWWGIAAKGPPDAHGLYEVYPRAAYYALRDAFRLDPYAPGTDPAAIAAHFDRITAAGAALEARGASASLETDALGKVRVKGLRLEYETYSTGGENVSTPPSSTPQAAFPSYRGFDNGQSFYADLEAKPSGAVTGRLSLNVLGHVARNRIDEVFYENRGRPQAVRAADGSVLQLDANERVKVYRSSLSWNDKRFDLEAFYRAGHLHWQYEGDFFGLYRDAYYGENVDIYNGEAPIGFEIAGKRGLAGLKAAFGPQLWWGANPAAFLKYQRRAAGADWTVVFQDDFTQQTQLSSSVAIPVRKTRKASLQLKAPIGRFVFEGGVLWSGQPRVGETFQLVDEALLASGASLTPADVRQDAIVDGDTFGCKGKLTWQRGRWNWYAQGAYMGLVAEAGPTAIPTFTGWELRDSGSGNQANALTGVAVTLGNWQVGPNFLWQKPVVGPMPGPDQLAYTQGRPRDILSDPFAVRGNRETKAAELMVVYDPTPATWMWTWDSDAREDADLAASLGLVFRRHETTADAGLFISAENLIYPFPGGTPPRDLWELHARVANRVGAGARMIGHLYWGTAEPNGADRRLVHRFGADARIAWRSAALAGYLKLDDFGPYDYHRDFNLTYPLQAMADASLTLGSPVWFSLPQTKLGVRLTYRTLDRHSNRYAPEGYAEPAVGELYPEGLPDGREWEIRTYLHLSL